MRIIAGEARGRRIEAPDGKNTRPTLDRVRENIFNILQNDIAGRSVLDLFAGSGALSLEALSRGAACAVLVDHDFQANRIERKNVESLRMEDRATILRCDWQSAVQSLAGEGRRFGLIFLDPPYAAKNIEAVFQALVPLADKHTLIVYEHVAKGEIPAPVSFEAIKQRSWGYCGMVIYKLTQKTSQETEEE